MTSVSIVHWNPRSLIALPLLKRSVRIGPRVNNFGDLLGPLISGALSPQPPRRFPGRSADQRLLAVGSIVHLARDGDCLWGTGVNGKIPDADYSFTNLDVRAVRGPLTRDFLLSRGIDVPEVYGDPALLLPSLFPWLREISNVKKFDVTIVPNLNDLPREVSDHRILNPRSPLRSCLERIAQSEFVVGSSLHGVVVAEALGVPARLVKSSVEDPFKYCDYYLGTGRQEFSPAVSVSEALQLGGESPIIWNPEPLLRAFPVDLWGKGRD